MSKNQSAQSLNSIHLTSPFRMEKNVITQEQAIELADKYLLHTGRVALRDNISVIKSDKEWRIVAKTTPIILGMDTEMTAFSIDAKTGEVGASITIVVSLTDVLREINEKTDVDKIKKEQLKTKLKNLKIQN